jgi:hypothetical protein
MLLFWRNVVEVSADDHFHSKTKRKSHLAKMPDLVKKPHSLSMCHAAILYKRLGTSTYTPYTGGASGTLRMLADNQISRKI